MGCRRRALIGFACGLCTDHYWTVNRPEGFELSAESVVAAYHPQHVRREIWAEVARVVKCAVLHSTASESTARRYCSHAAAFGAWAWVEGIAGDGSELFRLDLIERYIEVGMPSAAESTRATRRSILRRIARHVSPDLKNLPAPTPLPYRRVRPPYSNDEVAGYFRLARSQPTEARHQSVAGVLLLGLGCGMDCRDLGWVRGSDVTMSDGVITVRVCGGSRPRTVVCEPSRHVRRLQSLGRMESCQGERLGGTRPSCVSGRS